MPALVANCPKKPEWKCQGCKTPGNWLCRVASRICDKPAPREVAASARAAAAKARAGAGKKLQQHNGGQDSGNDKLLRAAAISMSAEQWLAFAKDLTPEKKRRLQDARADALGMGDVARENKDPVVGTQLAGRTSKQHSTAQQRMGALQAQEKKLVEERGAQDKKIADVQHKIAEQRKEIERTAKEAHKAYGAIIGPGATSFEAVAGLRAWSMEDEGGEFLQKACGSPELAGAFKDALEKVHAAHAAAAAAVQQKAEAEQQAAVAQAAAVPADAGAKGMDVDDKAADVNEHDFMAAASALFARHAGGNDGKGDAAELKRANDEIANGLWTMVKKSRRTAAA